MATPFVPFYTGDLLETQRPGERDVLDVPTTWGEGFGAQFTDMWQGSPGPMLFRWAQRQGAEYDQSPLLQPEEANRRFSFAGQAALFDQPITEARARDIWDINRSRLRRENVIARSSLGGFGSFVAGLAGGALDPLNIAAGVVPGLVAARFGVEAAAIGARGTVAARAAWGAAEGAAGTALILPLWVGLSHEERRPFTADDAFMAVVFGTVLGAGLHAGVAAFRNWRSTGTHMPPIEQALQNTSAETRSMLLRGAVSNVMEGRPVDVAPLVDNVFQTQLRPKVSLARALEVGGKRVEAEEGAALGAITRIEGKNSVDELNTRISELERSAGAMRTEAAAARNEAASAFVDQIADPVTASRILAIDNELGAPGLTATRRATLDAEKRMLTEGAAENAEANLNRLRATTEAQGLETAATRADRERGRLARTAQRRSETVAEAQRAFKTASGKAADKRAVLQALTERTLRRAIGDKIKANVRTIDASEFTTSALRIMQAERTAAPAVIQAELQRLGKLGGMATVDGSTAAAAGSRPIPAAAAGLPGEGAPGTVQSTAATQQRQGAVTDIARRNAQPYVDPEGTAASQAADEAVAAAGATPIKARTPDQGIGAESPAIRELDELTAVDEAMVDDMRKLGTLDAADEDYLKVADEQIAKAEQIGRARDLAAICLVTGAP